jgi:Arc/MetJ-type ribon-helix-helix transcriptional regulator
MGIEIPAHIEDRVRQLVEDGRYETDADVLRAAIGALESRDAEAKKRRL